METPVLDELAERAKHDADALTLLLERTRPILVKIARRDGAPSEEDAEDLAQVALLRISLHIQKFDAGRARFLTWAGTITSRLVWNHFRNRQRRRKTAERYAQTTEAEPEIYTPERPDRWVEAEEARQRLYAAIERLDSPYRETVQLCLEDRPYREIAEKLGVETGTIKSRMNRATRQLKRDLASA